jgi:hypothetical protein
MALSGVEPSSESNRRCQPTTTMAVSAGGGRRSRRVDLTKPEIEDSGQEPLPQFLPQIFSPKQYTDTRWYRQGETELGQD